MIYEYFLNGYTFNEIENLKNLLKENDFPPVEINDKIIRFNSDEKTNIDFNQIVNINKKESQTIEKIFTDYLFIRNINNKDKLIEDITKDPVIIFATFISTNKLEIKYYKIFNIKEHVKEIAKKKNENIIVDKYNKKNKDDDHIRGLLGIFISIILLLFGYFYNNIEIIKISFLILSYLAVGFNVIYLAFKNIKDGHIFDEYFLISIATVGAIFLGEYIEGITVMIFFKSGIILKDVLSKKKKQNVNLFNKITVKKAIVINESGEIEQHIESVKIGDIILVKPGSIIPLDGIIIDGNTTIDTKILTGEPKEVFQKEGSKVLAGTKNILATIKVKVTSNYLNSTISKIINLVRDSSREKTPQEEFLNKFMKKYTPLVSILSIIVVIIPTILFPETDILIWCRRALAIMVISCPCALILSAPQPIIAGITLARKKGLVIKSGHYLEMLSNTEKAVFDKTGTLTNGEYAVLKVRAFDYEEDYLIKIAATILSFHDDLISRAITTYNNQTIDLSLVSNVNIIHGNCVTAFYGEFRVHIGNKKFMDSFKINVDEADEDLVIYIAIDNKCVGYFVLADTLKENAINISSELKKLGIEEITLLTCDKKRIADKINEQLNFDHVYADLNPGEKLLKLREIMDKTTNNVIYIGDGYNDIPLIDIADIGVAVDAPDAKEAIDAADIAILSSSPYKIVDCIKISKEVKKKSKENITIAIFVKVISVILGVFGIVNMVMAILIDLVVTILLMINSFILFNRDLK